MVPYSEKFLSKVQCLIGFFFTTQIIILGALRLLEINNEKLKLVYKCVFWRNTCARLWLIPASDNSKTLAREEFALFVFSDIFNKLLPTSNYFRRIKWIFEIPPAFKSKPTLWSYLFKVSSLVPVTLKYSNCKPQKIQIELSNFTYSFLPTLNPLLCMFHKHSFGSQ